MFSILCLVVICLGSISISITDALLDFKFIDKKLLEMQDDYLVIINQRVSIKKYIQKKIHSSIMTYKDELGRKCYVRILKYIEGEMYARIKTSDKLQKSLGFFLGN